MQTKNYYINSTNLIFKKRFVKIILVLKHTNKISFNYIHINRMEYITLKIQNLIIIIIISFLK